ncbi:MAG: hypothetical protein Q8Q42_02830 [Nanoarchaeota archaeon]|nr:hypothetical protein [Nanoarchaeota archaeon]
MKLNKRAITPAISWILLMGMAVVLAGVVTIWMKSTAESSTSIVIGSVEVDMQCNDISVNAYETPGKTQCSSIEVINNGLFSITAIKVRDNDGVADFPYDPPLKPGESITTNLNNPSIPTNNEIGLIPITLVNDKAIACMEKETTIICS